MPKFNWQWFSFHYGKDIKPLFLELQAKKWLSKIEFNTYGYFDLNLGPSCFLSSMSRQQNLRRVKRSPAKGLQGSSFSEEPLERLERKRAWEN
jgi:hypothetical protein